MVVADGATKSIVIEVDPRQSAGLSEGTCTLITQATRTIGMKDRLVPCTWLRVCFQ